MAISEPPLACAILQSIAHEHGITDTNVLDLNLSQPEDYLDKFENYDCIALSIFSRNNMQAGYDVLCQIKKQYPEKIVIIGGFGVRSTFKDGMLFGEYCLKENLTTYYVYGEGENAFYNIISDNLPSNGVNNTRNNLVEDLDLVPFPSFDNYDLMQYNTRYNDGALSTETSRACVRDCSFCTIKSLFDTYRYKTSERIFDELTYLANKYNITRFCVHDSLINGSSKQFRSLCNMLVDAPIKLQLTGQYIIRSERQNPESDFKLMQAAGFKPLILGLESYSESVRTHMNKKFSNEDVDYCLNMCAKYDIQCYLLMMVGYVTETEEDHQQTLDFFKKYAEYAKNKIITGVELGPTLSIDENTPLYDMIDDLGVKYLNNDYALWYTDDLTVKRRVERRIEATLAAQKYNFEVSDNNNEHLKDLYKRATNE